jgi:hypothetical protein
MDSIPWVHHSREEGSLDYDGRLVRLQVYLNFNMNIYRQQRREAQHKHVSYDLRDVVDKTYGPIVADRLRPIFFRDEDYVSFVEEVEVLASKVVEGVNCCHNVVLY